MWQKLKNVAPVFHKVIVIINYILLFLGCMIGLIVSGTVGNPLPLLFFLMEAGILIGALSLEFIIAGYFYFAARDKGYKDLAYLRIAFFLPLVGYLLVIALPNKRKIRIENEQIN